MMDSPAIDFSAPTPSVGHVCVGSPTGNKPGLCWICGQFLPHDYVGSAQPTADRLDGFALLPDAQVTHGPPLNAATNTHPAQFHLDIITARVQSWLDKQGHDRCWYYPEIFESIAEELDLARTIAPSLPPCAEFMKGCERYQAEQYSQVGIQAANRLAPPNAPTGRKWPIGTPEEHTYAQHTWACRLQQARTHRGLTLDVLARRLDPPRTRKDISAMEHGRRGLSVELCAQLADALDCDRLWLAGWTTER